MVCEKISQMTQCSQNICIPCKFVTIWGRCVPFNSKYPFHSLLEKKKVFWRCSNVPFSTFKNIQGSKFRNKKLNGKKVEKNEQFQLHY